MHYSEKFLEVLRKNYAHTSSLIKSFLSFFFYRIAQSIITSKIRSRALRIASAYDLAAVILSWLLAYWVLIDTMADISVNFQVLRDILPDSTDKAANNLFIIEMYAKQILVNLFIIIPLQLILFKKVGLYRGFWRFASVQDLKKILKVSLLGGLTAWIVLQINSTHFMNALVGIDTSNIIVGETNYRAFLPRYLIALLYTVFLIGSLASARLFIRYAKEYRHMYSDFKRVIIVGAGDAGEGLVRDLLRESSHRYKPVVIVDDDMKKIGRELHGVRIAGTIQDIPKLISLLNIDLVIIAIPSASSARIRSVVAMCESAKIPCSTLPGLKDIANGHVSINILRSISLEDLLGRYPVTIQWPQIKTKLENKTILVTGGGGSIGSELCRQLATLDNLSQLIIVDSNEFNLYSIDMELRQRFPHCRFTPVLLSVTDRVGIQNLLRTYQPHMVFHAAAYKHVPLLENQARIAVFNNIIGTKIIAEESARANVETFVLISTDKAVNPTNIMGATKRSAEYFCQNFNDHAANTRFITVRFGNVLDSAGSVVPLFRKQIEAGGPVTVTHPEITRFFMTIPEASQLILQAAFQGEGGEIFVLDMGESIKIRYLAEQMIKLSGKILDQDIKIVYTGLRPGEKLYEEYFYADEALQPTSHTKILRARSQKRDFAEIKELCEELKTSCESPETNINKIVSLLHLLVPEYKPQQACENIQADIKHESYTETLVEALQE